MSDSTTTLSPEICAKIDAWVKRYPAGQQRSGVFEALRLVQEAHQYLTVPLMDAVAAHLAMPPIAVYEIATFYTMFHTKPVGQHVINVCTNISCALNKASQIVEHLKKRLQIDWNETTPDGKWTLKEVECLGACVSAPVCQIDKTYHVALTPEKVDEILDSQ